MIDDAIEYIRQEVRHTLGISDTEVIAGNVHALKDDTSSSGIYVSLVNIEEEASLKNTSQYTRVNGELRYKEPPVFVNLFLLFAFDFSNYGTSVLRLGQTIELFQSKPHFSAENQLPANPFPAGLERLRFDLFNLNFEQLNHLWGVLGGAYLPSVLYKVRLVKVQRDETSTGPEITTIQLDVNAR